MLAADFLPPVWLPDERTRSLRRQVIRRLTAGTVGSIAPRRWRRPAESTSSPRWVSLANQLSRMASAPGFPGPNFELEMNRRLKEVIGQLTTELIAFRESSDRAARRLSRLTNVLIALTVVLVVLTVIITLKG